MYGWVGLTAVPTFVQGPAAPAVENSRSTPSKKVEPTTSLKSQAWRKLMLPNAPGGNTNPLMPPPPLPPSTSRVLRLTSYRPGQVAAVVEPNRNAVVVDWKW